MVFGISCVFNMKHIDNQAQSALFLRITTVLILRLAAPLQPGDQLAHDAAAKRQHAHNKDQPGNDGDRLAQGGEPLNPRRSGQPSAQVANLVFQRHHRRAQHQG